MEDAEPEPAEEPVHEADEADEDCFDDATTVVLGEHLSPPSSPGHDLVDSEDEKPCPPFSSDEDADTESSDDSDGVPNIPADSRGNVNKHLNLADLNIPPPPEDPMSAEETHVTPPKRAAAEDKGSSMKAAKLRKLATKEARLYN